MPKGQKSSPVILIFFAILIGIAYILSLVKEKKEEIPLVNWINYEEGLEQANSKGKFVLIDFYTDWCGPCKKIDRTTYRDSLVISFLRENFILIKVNIGKVSKSGESMSEKEIGKKYEISIIPTTVILTSQGTPLGRFTGYRDPVKFIEELRSIISK